MENKDYPTAVKLLAQKPKQKVTAVYTEVTGPTHSYSGKPAHHTYSETYRQSSRPTADRLHSDYIATTLRLHSDDTRGHKEVTSRLHTDYIRGQRLHSDYTRGQNKICANLNQICIRLHVDYTRGQRLHSDYMRGQTDYTPTTCEVRTQSERDQSEVRTRSERDQSEVRTRSEGQQEKMKINIWSLQLRRSQPFISSSLVCSDKSVGIYLHSSLYRPFKLSASHLPCPSQTSSKSNGSDCRQLPGRLH